MSLTSPPQVDFRLIGLEKIAKGDSAQADYYLLKASNATSQEGVENLGNWFGHHSPMLKKLYKLKAQMDYAEAAIKVAPGYAKAHLRLAQYAKQYADGAIAPDTKTIYYKKSYLQAAVAEKLDSSLADQAGALRSAIEPRLIELLPQAYLLGEFKDYVSRKIIEYAR